jgi:acyl-CoA thioesterase FadM
MLASYVARLGYTFAEGMSHPRAPIDDEFRLPLRIWPFDLDTFGHLNNGRFLTLMDNGRFGWQVRTRLLKPSILHRWRPVIAAVSIRFRRELKPFQRCTLHTQLLHWDERSFYFSQKLKRGETLHSSALVRAVVQSKERLTPAQMFAAVGYLGPAPPPTAELQKWISSWG